MRDDVSIFYYAQCARALSLYHLRRLYHLAMYGYPRKLNQGSDLLFLHLKSP